MTLPCIEITRARIGTQPSLDVSAETSIGLGMWLAPPAVWETSRASGILHVDAYRARYEELLEGIPERIYCELYTYGREQGLIRLLCRCPEGQFCHTVVLARWLARRYCDAFYTRLTLPGDLSDPVVRFAVTNLGAVIAGG